MFYSISKSFLRTSFTMRKLRGLATISAQSFPFPAIKDTIDPSCSQLTFARFKAEEHLSQLRQLTKICLSGGGEKGVTSHVKKKGKILVRDRIRQIMDDDGDFLELGLLAGLGMEYGDIPAGGIVIGIGKVQGVYCLFIATDATVKGGAAFPITVKKGLHSYTFSSTNVLPGIHLVDSGGAYLPLQSEIFVPGGRLFRNITILSNEGVTQVSLVCGSCTAGAAYEPLMCEDAGIVNGIGTVFLAGPPLVKAATGETVSAEELGGATMHCRTSGCTDYFSKTEEDGFQMLRDTIATLNFLPVSSSEYFEQSPFNSEILCAISGLEQIDRQMLYRVIGCLTDGGRFREFKEDYGDHLITGYALLEGKCIGVLANVGPLTYKDGMKGAHFVQNCQFRSLPMVFLQNSGSASFHEDFLHSLSPLEAAETLRGRATMASLVASATVAKVTVNIGGCHGDDNYVMCGPSFGAIFNLSWPNARFSHRMNCLSQETSQSDAKSRSSSSRFDFRLGSAFYMASHNLIDCVIRPSDTRKIVAQTLRICRQKERHRDNSKEFAVLRF